MKAGFPHGSDLRLSGVGVFANFNWNHSIGVEGRARFLNFNSWYGETEQDYLAGPRYTFLHSDKWRPYASFQVGMAKVQYPFKLGSASFLAMTPGGGLEYRVGRKWSVQASYEYQILPNSPNFSNEPKFGIRPNGPQVGISYRLR
jgi:opacity protein-like surface antigen